MARRRGRISQAAINARRASPPVPSRPKYAVQVYPTKKIIKIDYRLYEDRRNYHPVGKLHSAGVIGPRDARRIVDHYRKDDLRRFTGWRSHLYRSLNPLRDIPVGWLPASRQAFKVPDRVLICVRRQRRREVLFAFRGTGKGSRQKKRERNYWSEISCKRR